MSEIPTFDEVSEAIAQQVCPVCHSGRLSLERHWQAREPGSYSLAGHQVKVSAVEQWIAACSACEARFNVDGAEYQD